MLRATVVLWGILFVGLLTACDSDAPAPTVPADVAALQTRTAALRALNDAQATFAAGGAQAPQPGRTALGAMTLTGPGTATAIAQAIAAVQTQLAANLAQPTAPPQPSASPTP